MTTATTTVYEVESIQEAGIAHGIVKDGKFHVTCKDKVGIFYGSAPGLHGGKGPYPLADAVKIAESMAAQGYRYERMSPGLLLSGEMTICRVG